MTTSKRGMNINRNIQREKGEGWGWWGCDKDGLCLLLTESKRKVCV